MFNHPADDEPGGPAPMMVCTDGGALWSWQWELQATGAGPDHAALLRFEEQQAGQLRSAVACADLRGFVRHDHGDAEGAAMLTWINKARAAEFAGNVSGRQRSNIWTYRAIEVRACTLRLENGYGDWTPADVEVQTRLLYQLAAHENGLTLVEWRIGTSDSGVFLGSIAGGNTMAELLKYLRFSARENQLHSEL